jgi:hypothetical protein
MATPWPRSALNCASWAFPSIGPSSASLEPGLSLGRFSTEEAAQRGLGNLAAKGVRTAKVVQERPDTPGYQLRLPSVDDALRPQLDVLRPAMAGSAL